MQVHQGDVPPFGNLLGDDAWHALIVGHLLGLNAGVDCGQNECGYDDLGEGSSGRNVGDQRVQFRKDSRRRFVPGFLQEIVRPNLDQDYIGVGDFVQPAADCRVDFIDPVTGPTLVVGIGKPGIVRVRKRADEIHIVSGSIEQVVKSVAVATLHAGLTRAIGIGIPQGHNSYRSFNRSSVAETEEREPSKN